MQRLRLLDLGHDAGLRASRLQLPPQPGHILGPPHKGEADIIDLVPAVQSRSARSLAVRAFTFSSVPGKFTPWRDRIRPACVTSRKARPSLVSSTVIDTSPSAR